MGEMFMLLANATGEIDVTGATGMIANLGFPIFVAVWLLWKSHKDTSVIQESINKLENAILELNTYIRTLNGKSDK